MYTVVQSEPGLCTVGFYDDNGKWHSEADYDTIQDAWQAATELNNG